MVLPYLPAIISEVVNSVLISLSRCPFIMILSENGRAFAIVVKSRSAFSLADTLGSTRILWALPLRSKEELAPSKIRVSTSTKDFLLSLRSTKDLILRASLSRLCGRSGCLNFPLLIVAFISTVGIDFSFQRPLMLACAEASP